MRAPDPLVPPSLGSHKTSFAVDNQLTHQGFLGGLNTKRTTEIDQTLSLLRESLARRLYRSVTIGRPKQNCCRTGEECEWPGVAWPPHLKTHSDLYSSTTGMNCTDLYRPSEVISPTSLLYPLSSLRLQGHTPRSRDPRIAITVVILKPKNDEEIEADNFVRRDYVCKNEFFCFLLNFGILVVLFVCFLCLPE